LNTRNPRTLVRGLSLLEVIVTVAIFAMLFAVLMTGWLQSMRAQAQLSTASDAVQRRQHISIVLRQTLMELVNPQLSSGSKFKGDEFGFTAETGNSLNAELGAAPVAIELRAVETGGLRRVQIKQDGKAQGQFGWDLDTFNVRYVDAAGQVHDAWPLNRVYGQSASPFDDPDQLPSLIVLTFKLRGDALVHQVLVHPRSSSWELSEPTPPSIGIDQQ